MQWVYWLPRVWKAWCLVLSPGTYVVSKRIVSSEHRTNTSWLLRYVPPMHRCWAVWIIQQPWRGGATGWRRWDLNLKSSFGAHVTAGIPSDGATRDGLYIEVVSCAECGHTQVDKKSVVKNEVVINPRIRKDKNGSILWNPSTAVLLLKNRRNEWDQWTTGA